MQKQQLTETNKSHFQIITTPSYLTCVLLDTHLVFKQALRSTVYPHTEGTGTPLESRSSHLSE